MYLLNQVNCEHSSNSQTLKIYMLFLIPSAVLVQLLLVVLGELPVCMLVGFYLH